jgi:hypothetical protein
MSANPALAQRTRDIVVRQQPQSSEVKHRGKPGNKFQSLPPMTKEQLQVLDEQDEQASGHRFYLAREVQALPTSRSLLSHIESSHTIHPKKRSDCQMYVVSRAKRCRLAKYQPARFKIQFQRSRWGPDMFLAPAG